MGGGGPSLSQKREAMLQVPSWVPLKYVGRRQGEQSGTGFSRSRLGWQASPASLWELDREDSGTASQGSHPAPPVFLLEKYGQLR